jgi:hypothetical protein
VSDAAILARVAEDWLRRVRCDRRLEGYRFPPDLLAVLGRLAEAAPGVAAGCPALLDVLPPRVRWAVKAQALALAASEAAPGLAAGPSWLTTQQAAAQLGITADGVRWLLRRGQLDGRRTERGWQVDAGSVRRRRVA